MITIAAIGSFAALLNREPAAMCKTMTYDQGREMHGHKILSERTGVHSYRRNHQINTLKPFTTDLAANFKKYPQ
jgi:IS30 family transposase